MAEQNERSSFNSLSFGIQDTEVMGDFEGAEAFLTDEKIEPIKKEEPKKAEPVIVQKPAEEKEEEDPIDPIDPLAELDNKEEKELEDAEDKKEEEDEKTDPESFDYNALSKDLFKIGVFTEQEDEEEIKTPEEIVARFQKEKQLGATSWLENFLAQHGEDRREMFQAIYIDGVDPKDYIPVFNQIQDFESIDLSVEDNQKQIFREFYRRVGLEDATIEKKLQKAMDYGDLETDATEFKPQLINQDKKKLEDIQETRKVQEENSKRLDLEYKSNLQKQLAEAIQKKEFKGLNITQDKAAKVFDFLYSPKYKTADGKVLTEFDKFVIESKRPENIDQRILLGLLKLDNFDFSSIEKKAISKESGTLFSELAHKAVKKTTRDINKIPSGKSAWSQL